MPDTLTETLFDICARPIDGAARDRAAVHLGDWLACALAGSTTPADRALAAYGGQALSAGPRFTVGAPAGDV